MISVQNHRHTILLRHRSGMISSGHCASDGSMELSVVLGRPLNGPPILDGDLAKWLAWDYSYISRSSYPDMRDPCPRPLLLEKLFVGGCGGFKQDPYERPRNPKPTARECPSPSRHKIEIHQLKTGSWWEHPSCVPPAKQHQHQRQYKWHMGYQSMSLNASIDGWAADAIHRGDGIAILLGMVPR